jgi:hypothetical protein
MPITAADILNKAVGFLGAKVSIGQARTMAVAQLMVAPRNRLVTAEYDVIYTMLIRLIRSGRLIEQKLTQDLDRQELLAYEVAFNRFLEILPAVERSEIRLMPAAKEETLACKAYAKFYAGIFALARGDGSTAFEHLMEAEDVWSIGLPAVQEALASSELDKAGEKLGTNFVKIAEAVKTAAAPPKPAPTAPPLKIEKVEVIDKGVPPPETLLSPADKTKLVAAGIREAGELLDEGKTAEAWQRIVSAAEFIQTPEEAKKLELLKLRCLPLLGKFQEAWAILQLIGENDPLYLKTAEERLLTYLGLGQAKRKEGFDLLRAIDKKKIWPSWKIQEFRARFIMLDPTAENLERAEDIVLQLIKSLNYTERFDVANGLTNTLLKEIQQKILKARADRATAQKKEKPLITSTTEPAEPAEEPAAAPVVIPAELIAREKKVMEAEAGVNEQRRRLEEMAASLAARERAILEKEKALDEREERLDAALADLRYAQRKLTADQEELRRAERELEIRMKQRVVLEVGKVAVPKKRTLIEVDLGKLAALVVEGKLSEAAGFILHLEANDPPNIIRQAIARLLEQLDKIKKEGLPEIAQLRQ